jgi:hypothetical protein
LGVYFILLAAVLSALLVWLFMIIWKTSAKLEVHELEVKLILLVMVTGALGSYVHAATSFADFVGNRQLARSWVWWYVLRPFIGVGLALIFYFVVRGGLLSVKADATDVSLFGIIAVAGLAGMFSKQATDKLSEVFDTLFKTQKGEQRKDKLENPSPTLAALEPPTVAIGSEPVELKIQGTDFVNDSVVRFDGVDRATTFASSTQLVTTLSAGDIAAADSIVVTVYNPPPGGGVSSPRTLIVR